MRSAHDQAAAIAAATARDRLLIAARRGGDMTEVGDQLAALLDVAACLDAGGVPYALIGGVAVGIQSASPRATNDIDVAVRTSTARDDLAAVLEAGGFVRSGSFEHSVNFRHPTGEPVQVAFDSFFDPMIDRAERLEIGGRAIPVLRKDDLIATKERAAADPARRPSKALRDRADAELLRGDVGDPDEGW